MKFVDVSCPACGARLEITDVQEFVTCEHCGKQFFVDDEVKRSETRIEHHYSAEDAENAGYLFEKGRMRARQEAEWEELSRQAEAWARFEDAEREQNKGCLKFLLWIFFFPIMFLYWLATTDRLSKKAKIIIAVIIIAVWAFGSHNKSKTETQSIANMEQTESVDKPISYDALQKLFLRIDDSITPEKLDDLLNGEEFKSVVWKRKTDMGYNKYIVAYSEKVAKEIRGEHGDYLTIDFDSGRNNNFMNAVYHKNGKDGHAILLRYGYYFGLGSSNPDDQSKWGYYYYSWRLGKGGQTPYITCTDAKDALNKVLTRE